MVRRQIASEIFVASVLGLRKCIRPVSGAELLAIMESARRWSTKWVELLRFSFPHRLEQRRLRPFTHTSICLANLRGKLRRRRVGKVGIAKRFPSPYCGRLFQASVRLAREQVRSSVYLYSRSPMRFVPSCWPKQRRRRYDGVALKGKSTTPREQRAFVPSASPRIGRREASCVAGIRCPAC